MATLFAPSRVREPLMFPGLHWGEFNDRGLCAKRVRHHGAITAIPCGEPAESEFHRFYGCRANEWCKDRFLSIDMLIEHEVKCRAQATYGYEPPLTAPVPQGLKARSLNPATRGSGQLTPLQVDVLLEICTGATDEAIAHRMDLSVNTVKLRIKDLLWRLDASCRAQAVHEAYQRGILVPQKWSTDAVA